MGAGVGIPEVTGSFKAYDTDLVNKQFRIMKITSAGTVDFATAATDLTVVGVLQNKPVNAGDACTVVVGGESKLVAGGTINAGAVLVADSNGDAVAITPGNTTPNGSVGIALEGAVDNDVFRAFIKPGIVLV